MKTPGLRRVGRLARAGIAGCGFLLLLQLLLGVTGLPAPWVRWITGGAPGEHGVPDIVVVLGGGGIPSQSGLMRTYYAAQTLPAAAHALFIVSLPTDRDPDQSGVGRMRDELVLRGVPPANIRMEYRAGNTYEQAVAVREMLGDDALEDRVLLVTSPSHMRRALLCFEHQGFRRLVVLAAANTGAEVVPGGWAGWRYRFWHNLEFNIRVAREMVALGVYRLRGWIG